MTSEKENRKALAMVRTQTMERAQGNALPIEFRTLSINVTETHRSNKGTTSAFGSKGKSKPKDEGIASETDFFATVDFHKLTPAEINLRFNSNETLGLGQVEAERRLRTNGPNTLASRKPSYIKKVLGYVFGGFCSVLWIGVITFFICWQPILQPEAIPTNLALAILVVRILPLPPVAFYTWLLLD